VRGRNIRYGHGTTGDGRPSRPGSPPPNSAALCPRVGRRFLQATSPLTQSCAPSAVRGRVLLAAARTLVPVPWGLRDDGIDACAWARASKKPPAAVGGGENWLVTNGRGAGLQQGPRLSRLDTGLGSWCTPGRRVQAPAAARSGPARRPVCSSGLGRRARRARRSNARRRRQAPGPGSTGRSAAWFACATALVVASCGRAAARRFRSQAHPSGKAPRCTRGRKPRIPPSRCGRRTGSTSMRSPWLRSRLHRAGRPAKTQHLAGSPCAGNAGATRRVARGWTLRRTGGTVRSVDAGCPREQEAQRIGHPDNARRLIHPLNYRSRSGASRPAVAPRVITLLAAGPAADAGEPRAWQGGARLHKREGAGTGKGPRGPGGRRPEREAGAEVVPRSFWGGKNAGGTRRNTGPQKTRARRLCSQLANVLPQKAKGAEFSGGPNETASSVALGDPDPPGADPAGLRDRPVEVDPRAEGESRTGSRSVGPSISRQLGVLKRESRTISERRGSQPGANKRGCSTTRLALFAKSLRLGRLPDQVVLRHRRPNGQSGKGTP